MYYVMKQFVIISFTLLFAFASQASLPRDKFIAADGSLTNTLTFQDGQVGFVGITDFIWTVRPDGSWDRKRFTNGKVGGPDQKGKLNVKQRQSLADVLVHAQIHKLPAKMGTIRGAKPQVLTLSWGKHICVWTFPAGSPVPKYPDLPFGKLTSQDSFSEISQALRKLLKTPQKK